MTPERSYYGSKKGVSVDSCKSRIADAPLQTAAMATMYRFPG